MFKKLNTLLILSMLLNLLPLQAFAQAEEDGFFDLSSESLKYDAINYLQTEGVVQGYPDGSFKERNRISRAEFTKIIVASQFSEEEISSCEVSSLTFPDINTEEWYAPFLCVAVEEGIISGYPDGTFKPADQIKFSEASKILAESFQLPESDIDTEWFSGYVDSLSIASAIPSTIDSLEIDLTRGDMAEMVYRLKTDNTSKPTQTLSNLTSQLGKITSCDALAERVEDQNYYPYFYEKFLFDEFEDFELTSEPSIMQSEDSAEIAIEASAGGGMSFSETNIQEAGVDEPDTVKTNGEYIYTVNTDYQASAVQITAANQGSLELKSSILFSNESPQGLFIRNNKLIVLTNQYAEYAPIFFNEPQEDVATVSGDESIQYKIEELTYQEEEDNRFEVINDAITILPGRYGSEKTNIYIFDVTNSSSPKLEREVTVEGSYAQARLIDGNLFFISSYYPDTYGYDNEELTGDMLVPQISQNNGEFTQVVDCEDISYLPNHSSSNFAVVTSFNLDEMNSAISNEVIIAPLSTIYMSKQNLYITQPKYNYWYFTDFESDETTQTTNIYKFNIENASTQLEGVMSVPGTLDDQFAMSEYDGDFRVTTTLDEWNSPSSESQNNLYVFDENMNRVGSLENLAPGERIYSTRFIGDRAYMVTFKQVDPLFVIDLSNSSQPTVLGELKIPGFSEYLHPYGEDYLLGFGQEASLEGQTQGMKVALFNVADPTNPEQLHTFKIGDRGTSSELLYNHRALLFSKEKNIIAFPVSIYETKQPGIDTWGDLTFEGAINLGLDLEEGFTLNGKYTHITDGIDPENPWDYDYNESISRLIYIGDYIYTISNKQIQSHNMQNNDTIDAVQLIK